MSNEITVWVPCDECDGTGKSGDGRQGEGGTCPECRGIGGKLYRLEEINEDNG